jgi:hypothetical protein
MKKTLSVVLLIVWWLSMFLGINLIGFALFVPALLSTNTELAMRLWNEQMLAVSGGRGPTLAAGAACVLVCIVLRKLLRSIRQAESDALAEETLNDVRGARPPSKPYFLYLRAFETTKRLKAPLFLLDLATLGLSRLWTGELESFLSASLRKVGPLIALGHPGENVGAGRVITSDQAWMDDIARLAAGAQGILLIPSHRPGTVWEIEHLQKTGFLSRTVFVMPPESRRFNWRSHWSQARGAMGPLGAALPEYEELGMVFTLNETDGIRGVEPFSLFFMRSLRKSILRLLAGPERETKIDSAIQKARRRSARWRLLGRMNLIARASAMVFFILVVLLGGSAKPPLHQRLAWPEFWREFLNASEIDEREESIASYFYDSQEYLDLAKALPAEQQDALRRELMHAGFRRLDDRQLRTAYLALSQLLERADAGTCRAIARDVLPAGQMQLALLKVDPNLLTDWLDMNREAAIAQLKNKPSPVVSYSALLEAKHQFEESLKPDELNRYRTLSAQGATKAAEDECWLARKSYAALGSLPESYGLTWARLLELQGERPVTHGLVTNPLEKLKALPAFQHRAQGMSEEKTSDLFGDLVGKGTPRLDDSVLLARLVAMGELLAKADGPTCDKISQGTASADQFEAALAGISEEGQAEFMDSQYRAAIAELEQSKPVLLSKAESDATTQRVGRLLIALEQGGAQDGDSGRPQGGKKCQIARRAYAAVSDLEEPYNRMWARLLVDQ